VCVCVCVCVCVYVRAERAPCRAAVESEQQEPSTAGSSGTCPDRQDSQPVRSQDSQARKSVRRPAPEDRSRKRKLEEPHGEKGE
jgi:hypothetical protein